MENLIISKTEDTPFIEFCFDQKRLLIEGRSLPEDVTTFYQPVIDRIENIRNIPEKTFNVQIKLEYFNTASSKVILDILLKLEDLHLTGEAKLNLEWFYDANDTDMLEAAEEYAELVEIPFDIKPCP